jgi:hypothetical protein
LIPEIDIWRAAQLIRQRYREEALEQNADRADELALGDAKFGRGSSACIRVPFLEDDYRHS